MDNQNLTKKIAYNTIVQVIGKFIMTGFSLVLVIYLTRYLGTFGFGEYNTILAFLGFFAIFVDFGLYTIAVREISQKKIAIDKIVGNLLTIRFILAIIIFSIASVVAFFMPYPLIVKKGILITSLGLFFTVLTQVGFSVFQANLRMDLATFTEVSGRIITFIITLIFIKLKYTLLAIILAYVIGNFFTLVISFYLSWKFTKFKFRFDWDIWRRLIKESYFLGIAGIFILIHFKIDSVLLSVLPLKQGFSNMYAVGIYGAAYKFVEVLVTIPGMFLKSVFPIMSERVIYNQLKVKEVFQKSFDVLAIVAVPLVIGTLITAPFLISIIGGEEFKASVLPLRILIFAVAFYFLGGLFSQTFVVYSLQKKVFYISATLATINFVLNLIFIPLFSFVGAAAVTFFSTLVGLILYAFILYRNTNLFPSLKIFGKIIFSSLIMGLFCFGLIKFNFLINWGNFNSLRLLIRFTNFLILVSISGVIYLLTLYLSKGISKETIKAIIGRR